MKKYILFFIYLFVYFSLQAADKFEFFPINIDFIGVESKGDTVIAYGSYGSLIISYDNAVTWKQRRVFDNGFISNVFFENNRIICFNNIGEINISEDNGNSWKNVANIKDSIYNVIKSPEGYYLNNRTKIYKLDNEFNTLNNILINFSNFNFNGVLISYRHSIAYLNGYLIAENNSGMLIKFDNNLIPLDTLYYSDYGINSNAYQQLYADSTNIYIQNVDNLNNRAIFKINNFTTIEKVLQFSKNYDTFKDSSNCRFYKIINNKIYSLNYKQSSSPLLYHHYIYDITDPNEVNKISTINFEKFLPKPGESFLFIDFNDMTITNNKAIIVAKNKTFSVVGINGDTTNNIFNFKLTTTIPDIINDSTYIFYNNDIFYISNNNTATFDIIKKDSSAFTTSLNEEFKVCYKDKDIDNKTIRLIGYFGVSTNIPIMLTSNDCFNTICSRTLTFFWLDNNAKDLSIKGKINAVAWNYKYLKYYTNIGFFDDNYNKLLNHYDSNYTINYIHAIDTNTFIISSNDSNSVIEKIKHTDDRAKTWKVIKEYKFRIDSLFDNEGKYLTTNINKEFLNCISININNKPYWLIFSCGLADSVFKIEALDLETHKFTTVYQNNSKAKIQTAFDNDKDSIYLVINDTIFRISDIFNQATWKYYVLPNNGRISTIKKMGDRFYIAYTDKDNQLISRYFLKYLGNDTLSSSVEKRTDPITYFYYFPPYPIPAINSVRTLIYWDSSCNIDNDEITVYDINGNKVCGREKISIEKQSIYNGYLAWDCSEVSTGLYLIKIKHGNNSIAIKVSVVK